MKKSKHASHVKIGAWCRIDAVRHETFMDWQCCCKTIWLVVFSGKLHKCIRFFQTSAHNAARPVIFLAPTNY